MWFTWLRPEKPITMSKPTFKITRSIRSQQVLNTFMERVLKNLSSTVGFDCLVVQTKTPLLIHPEKLSNSFLQFFKMLLHFGVEIVFRVCGGASRMMRFNSFTKTSSVELEK